MAGPAPSTLAPAPRAPPTPQASAAAPSTLGARPLAIDLSGIACHRGRRRTLGPLDLQVREGEAVAVLGPNGAGKSTLLHVAATLLEPTAGTRTVFGQDPRKEPEAVRRRLSVLTQQAPLYDELTPRQHLAWWARLRRLDQAEAGLDAALAEAGLARLAHRPCRELSRGERQRAALAMALLGDPDLLVLDEPFAALDARGRDWLERAIAARRGKAATLVALHDEAQAHRLADRVLALEGGRWAGPPEAVPGGRA